MKKTRERWGGLIISMILIAACRGERRPEATAPPDIASTAKVETTDIKNIVVLIGDGMGPQAVGLLNAFAKHGQNAPFGKERITTLEQVMAEGTLGMVYTEPFDRLVVDSAASATQMASGKRSLSEVVGMDEKGAPVTTILDKAKVLGKATGLVSDTRITHATPAGYVAHRHHRNLENDIAQDLIEDGADIMLSGGLRHFLPSNASRDTALEKRLSDMIGDRISLASKRQDNRNLLDEAKAKGYALAFSKKDLLSVKKGKLLGLFTSSGFPYRIDVDVNAPDRTLPTLSEMTRTALEILSQDPDGFFLMVESGIIDWASHDNDVGSLLHELVRFDETLKTIHEFISKRDDTLLIVTADHETGGFGFSYSRRALPEGRPFPGAPTRDRIVYKPNYNFGPFDMVDKIFAQKKSFAAIFKQFDKLPPEDRSGDKGAAALMAIVNEATAFPISRDDAARVLSVEPNRFRVEGHGELDRPTFPKIDDFEAYYVYGDDVRRDILARVVADRQNVVWATGTHTSTPVPLIAWGNPKFTSRFSRLMHTTEWAETAMAFWE